MCLSFIKHGGEYENLPRLSHFNISVILKQKNESIMTQYVSRESLRETNKARKVEMKIVLRYEGVAAVTPGPTKHN